MSVFYASISQCIRKGLENFKSEPCAWPCSATSIPNRKEMVLVLLVQFPRFVSKFFLDVSDGCIFKAVTCIDW